MLCYSDANTDPYFNLAAEEFLLTNAAGPIFRLWRNSPSVIIGRNQNAMAEINTDYVKEHKIPVIRRLTGGGAVFHDLGNINFTFIDRRTDAEDTAEMFRRFTAPIIEAIRSLGINASLEGRNDLTVEGRKFSGNAVCIHGENVLQHGTILFSSSLGSLSAALRSRPEKFTGKSVRSNAARVTNLKRHLPEGLDMDVTGFMEYILDFISERTAGTECREFSPEEKKAIRLLSDNKYSTDEWNYGRSPAYGYSSSFRLPCGFFEIYMDVKQGRITSCRIMGDYFFISPVEEICRALTGVRHEYGDIACALEGFSLKDYFGEDIKEELISALVGTDKAQA